MVKLLKPAIERRLKKADSGIGSRKRAAEHICNYLKADPETTKDMPLKREQFYSACKDLLRDRDSERILLYLPFRVLEGAPTDFRKVYLDAWYRLLGVKDVRENFHTGDCFELDARPIGGIEYVVKCAHLTPWLLKFGYIDDWRVWSILNNNSDDTVLLQSFKDTWDYIRSIRLFGNTEVYPFTYAAANLPPRKSPEPLYVSKKRQKWLDERTKSFELLTPSARLEGPFSDNITAIESRLEEIASNLRPSEIVFVGGSQLKGYGTTNSDLDIWNLDQLETSEVFHPGSPFATHIYFDTIWLGGREAENKLEYLADHISSIYTDSELYTMRPEIRRRAIRSLESDLLLYRLLHKGFSRFTGIDEFYVPSEMEGDSPFYCDEYRKIATMLYAKYVWL